MLLRRSVRFYCIIRLFCIKISQRIRNYKVEIADTKKIIEQIELPTNDRYFQSLMLSELDENELEDRKKIKEMSLLTLIRLL